MSPLDILRRSFRPVVLPRKGQISSGVYFLIDNEEIIYCGGSRTSVFSRIGQHLFAFEFDTALWYPLPASVVFDYEGAFTRFLEPRFNDNAPFCRGYDNEILDGFGLATHSDPDAVALRWHMKRYGNQMKPVTKQAIARKLRNRNVESIQ